MERTPEHTEDNLPLVSIAMCTYNNELFLHEQIDSLLAQTYHNIEIIVVDDASTDNTKRILEKYAGKDSRFRYFINDHNIGYNRNFEKAFGCCTAGYIAICDQDDIWELNKIEIMMKQWSRGSSFIYSLSGTFWNNDFEGRKTAPDICYTDIGHVHKLVFNSPVHGHACMFKKELLTICTPFPEDIFYDWWMSMHAAATGTIGMVPHVLTWHRLHQTNSSGSIIRIKEKEERYIQLRKQCIHFIETFCNRNILAGPQKSSLLEYLSLLRKMDGRKFSWAMFRYVFKNRKLVFHYKKQSPLIFFSYLKHSIRVAYKGLL